MGANVPWYHELLSWADDFIRPRLAAQRLAVQKKEFQKRPGTKPIILHNHSSNRYDEPVFSDNDDSVGSGDAHQSMTDIAKACAKGGVVKAVLMTEHGLGNYGADKEIEWAKQLKREYGIEFWIGSEIGTDEKGDGGHVLYVPCKQEHLIDFVRWWEDEESVTPETLADKAYDLGDFVMVPHPGKGKNYDGFERYLKIKWRLTKAETEKLAARAKENGKILPVASANGNLPNADYGTARLALKDLYKTENVREFHENDAHWDCELHAAVVYGKMDGEFTGEKLYRMLENKACKQRYVDTDLMVRPWGKNLHLSNSAAQFGMLGL